eukprot:UC4_evm3s250
MTITIRSSTFLPIAIPGILSGRDFARNGLPLPADNSFLVLQLPWEYGVIPHTWTAALNLCVDEVWVPSYFVKNVLISEGVDSTQIKYIPHIVEVTGQKRQSLQNNGLSGEIHTKKRFRFLFIGGALHRKGIDLLLKAFIDEFALSSEANDEISKEQLENLYETADCYIHPFRGEGFGLPIFEAAARGIPVITTKASPATDVLDEDSAFLIEAKKVTCTVFPCSPSGIFSESTFGGTSASGRVPWWYEPNLKYIMKAMRLVFKDKNARESKATNGLEKVRKTLNQEVVVSMMQDRIAEIQNIHGKFSVAKRHKKRNKQICLGPNFRNYISINRKIKTFNPRHSRGDVRERARRANNMNLEISARDDTERGFMNLEPKPKAVGVNHMKKTIDKSENLRSKIKKEKDYMDSLLTNIQDKGNSKNEKNDDKDCKKAAEKRINSPPNISKEMLKFYKNAGIHKTWNKFLKCLQHGQAQLPVAKPQNNMSVILASYPNGGTSW